MECLLNVARGFKPENIEVNVKGRQVEMKARQEDSSEDGTNYSFREVSDPFSVECFIEANFMLTGSLVEGIIQRQHNLPKLDLIQLFFVMIYQVRRTFTMPNSADVDNLTASMEPGGRFVLRAPLLKDARSDHDGVVPIQVNRIPS